MNMPAYEIRKNCALWQVFYAGSTIVQFSSLQRARCSDWIAFNTHVLPADSFNSPQQEDVAQ